MVSSSSSRRSHTTTYKKKKILIVDDDPDISFSLKKALEEYNDDDQNKGGLFELVVDTFTDPADVVSNYNQPVMYDLLIIDIVMPKALSFQETVSSIREGGQVKSETKVRPLQSITSTVNETLSAKPTKEAQGKNNSPAASSSLTTKTLAEASEKKKSEEAFLNITT
jgi:CheY-like chemotaxis protein